MLSKNIKKYRKEQGFSQHQLAEKAGITYTTLIKLEGGFNNNPTLSTLLRLSDALNIPIDKLVR